MPNFILAGPEVAEKFGWVGQVATMPNVNTSCIELEFGLGYDNINKTAST